MATSSSVTASPSTQEWTYDVFLSFRGPDTRKTFIDYLYKFLENKGIRTFKDDNRMEKGDCISESLINGIRASKFFIPVFSVGYASSKWCLEELATVIECQKNLEQIVVPIFHHVEPSDVRKQEGSFGDSFKELTEKFGTNDEEKVRRWKEALKKAGELKGHHLQNDYNGYEATCAEMVATDINAKLYEAVLPFEENFVGLESRVNNIGNWLSLASYDNDDDVRFIGICGMGGIGKTTIANIVYRRFSRLFDVACSLADVRKHNNVIELQKALLRKILKEKSRVEIEDVLDGKANIRKRLQGKKVLIVLDDVDDPLEQLDNLVGGSHWFGRGSRVIITTRDAGVLRSHGVDDKYIYQVDILKEQEAIQLFRLYAFKKEPKTGVEELCGSVVRYCEGLPLALKLLGSHLCSQSAANWETILEKLKDATSLHAPKDKILNVLRISFDVLDPDNKNAFLDITCFFRNWREEYVKGVLNSNLCELIEKSLISVQNGRIEMHDRIQEMGRYIASLEKPWRLWQLKDAVNVQSGKMDHKDIDGISWLSGCSDGPVEISFREMINLKIFKVECYGDRFHVTDNDLPSSLRWLEIEVYRFTSLPESFASSELVGLSLRYSSLQNCRITQKLDKLTLLDLSRSKSLLETPDFDWMPNLRKLNLQYSMNLKVVHPSIGNLSKLVLLDLSECRNLESLPSFNQVSSLNSLDLCGCIELTNFPEIKERMPHLVELGLKQVGIIELHSSIQQLQGLTKLYLIDCKHLVCLSNGFCELKNLQVLVINGCNNLKSLPENLQSLNSLEYLNLNESYFDSFPESFNQLPRLQYLDIRNCENLEELPKLPETTRQLYADFYFSYSSDRDELADFPELQSVAFSSSPSNRLEYDFAEMCIHFPSRRKTPFSVTYPINYYQNINALRIFQYRCYDSNGITIDLNPGWNCQNFVGFAVCFLEDKEEGPTLRLQSYRDIVGVDHCTIIVKLSCKDNKNEVLQRKCDIVKSGFNELRDNYKEERHSVWFAYIPFSGLWPAKSNSVTPNDFSRFEVNFMDSRATAYWGCSLLYERSERPTSWDDSCEGSTTDIGPLCMLEYLNLSGKKFEHLPEDISRLHRLEYLDISGCKRLRRELPELPPNIKELYASTYLASESNIFELATKYSKLYSVSFSQPIDDPDFRSDSLVPEELAKKFIPITHPFLNRNTPFAITFPLYIDTDYIISTCFKYPHHDPHHDPLHDLDKISFSLEPTWYNHNFVGFVVCFVVPIKVRCESQPNIRPFRHCELITKLTHKDNGSEPPLETKCVISRLYDEEFDKESYDTIEDFVCFVYIPFSSFWPKSKAIADNTSPNHYLVFEATIQDLEFYGCWSCDLLYTDDKSLTEAIRQKRESGSSEGDSGEEGESIDSDEDVEEYESDAGHSSGAAMAKHRAEMQTNEVRGIRFTSSGVKTCIGSPPTKKRTRELSLTWLSQKLAMVCTSNPISSSDSGKEGKDEERGESLDGDEDVEEYEAKENNAAHVDEEEEGKGEQRKKTRLNKDNTPDIIINSRKQNKEKNEHGELLFTKERPPLVDDDVLHRLGNDCKQLHNLLRMHRVEECIELELDYNIFHHSCRAFVMIENIKDLFMMNWLDAPIIQVFIMYLHRLCNEFGVNSIGFMCPTKIAKVCVDTHLFNVIAYLRETMAKLQDKTFILAPYHQENHWLLLVICTSSRMVYVLDPMRCERDMGIKPLLNMVYANANQCGQQIEHFVIGWKNIQCPQQSGGWECGYNVMRYMYEICTTYFACTSLDEAFQEIEPYSTEKIDEIRNIWAKYFYERMHSLITS